MQKNILLVLSLFLFSGCRVLGVRTHFERDLDIEERQKVIWMQECDAIDNLKNDGCIYAITGTQLKKCLARSEKALVYHWDPHCSSEFCHPLSVVQHFCEEHDVDLFVITEFFMDCFSQIKSLKDFPLLAINERYYATDNCQRLENLFYTDLIGEDIYKQNAEISWYRYSYYENGNFVAFVRDYRTIINK